MQRLFDLPVWGRGFRPFFLLGASYGAAIVPLWVAMLGGFIAPGGVFDDPVLWHGHEMLYGFTMAIVAGFLLTAVANWTGGAPVRQIHLAGLCLLWLAGRVAVNSGLPYVAAAAVDIAFIPALAVSLAVPLLRARNFRNLAFLVMLSVLLACNIWVYAAQDKAGLYIAVLVIAAMMSLIGGRIIPSFTVSALRRKNIDARITDQPRLDLAALLLIVSLGICWLIVGREHVVSAVAALTCGAVHLARMRHWHTAKTASDPMLWVLHAGYAWLTLSFFMFGADYYLDALTTSLALHVMTAGAIGTLTIGMMVRVALGHTGRELKAGTCACLAFALMQAAIVVRVTMPLVDGGGYMIWLWSSSVLWAAAFAVYLAGFAPILLKKRPDGLPA